MFTFTIEFEIQTKQSLKDLSKIDKVIEEFKRLVESTGAKVVRNSLVNMKGDGDLA